MAASALFSGKCYNARDLFPECVIAGMNPENDPRKVLIAEIAKHVFQNQPNADQLDFITFAHKCHYGLLKSIEKMPDFLKEIHLGVVPLDLLKRYAFYAGYHVTFELYDKRLLVTEIRPTERGFCIF